MLGLLTVLDPLRFHSVGRKRRPNLGFFYLFKFILCDSIFVLLMCDLWPPYVIGQAIYIFILWFLLLFFPRLISVVRDWMSTILPHMVWP